MSQTENGPATPMGSKDIERSPMVFQSRERDSERLTRKPLGWWDRSKILLVLLGSWTVLLWALLARVPTLPLGIAAQRTAISHSWLLVLAGLEVIRQIHYFVSERSARYHQFWTKRVFGGLNRRTSKMNQWNRYRLGRAVKVLFFLVILDLVLAKIFNLPPAIALFQLPVLLFQAMPFILQLVFAFFFVIFQFVGLFWFLSRGGSEIILPDDMDVRFSDVKGQDNVLAKVKQTMLFLEKPEAIEEKGGKVPKGILLWGPPGTGKTMMAKAVAGETSKPFLFVDPGAFIQMFMGVGVLKVKALFRKARKLALRYGGMILFFDEADSLGNRGIAVGGRGQGPFDRTPLTRPGSVGQHVCNGISYLAPATRDFLRQRVVQVEEQGPKRDGIIAGFGGMGGGGMGVLPALLSELDGMEKPRGFFNRQIRRALGMKPKQPPKYRILTMMATNLPEALDPALLRPGRIDRMYKVGYPSKNGRIDTYRKYLGKVSHVITEDEIDRIATITPYYGGAQIEDLVNAALIHAIEDGRDTVEWKDMVKAKQLLDLGPPEDVEYIERERHAVAVHEACHAVVAYRVRHHLTIDIATIEKGGDYLGMVASIPPEDQFTRWRSEYEADIMVSLASLIGERIFFAGDSSSGVSGDLESATLIATMMEGYWGMGSTVASHGVTKEIGIGGGGKPGKGGEGKQEKDFLESSLGYRIEGKLAEVLERTKQLVEENRHAVLAVAHALEANKTVTGEDLEAVIEGRPGPLIDGRMYHTPEFVATAEAYHAAAVEAHKQYSRPSMPLPVLRPRELEPEPASAQASPATEAGAPDGGGEDRPGGDGPWKRPGA
ncbi:MAG TPA: AAA family ATPase [Actinomycetota bacterium]|nr:AAA family ATPase [Actinomycetota bacterium]